MALGRLPSCNLTALLVFPVLAPIMTRRSKADISEQGRPCRDSSGSTWSASFMHFPSSWTKVTDGEELRNRFSKDFEMVGKGRSWKDRGLFVMLDFDYTRAHRIPKPAKKVVLTSLQQARSCFIPSFKDSGTLPSPTMAILFFFFVFLLALHSGKLNSKAQARHV